jgi:hypothetical protein
MPKGTTSKETIETKSYGTNLCMVKFTVVLYSTTCKDKSKERSSKTRGRPDFVSSDTK